jgi:hypothetical protein
MTTNRAQHAKSNVMCVCIRHLGKTRVFHKAMGWTRHQVELCRFQRGDPLPPAPPVQPKKYYTRVRQNLVPEVAVLLDIRISKVIGITCSSGGNWETAIVQWLCCRASPSQMESRMLLVEPVPRGVCHDSINLHQ